MLMSSDVIVSGTAEDQYSDLRGYMEQFDKDFAKYSEIWETQIDAAVTVLNDAAPVFEILETMEPEPVHLAIAEELTRLLGLVTATSNPNP